ncbi:hypothetical protein D1641_07300 [Colidextribacter sp. OB.20]|uniref:hypothetical protein n=1 Tax=Colidextribacter sp. OB.20 TaxID=2304568 RepID=UPI00136C863E|nr:hypothetical protein [Colidextribacter sp. OB.20]NBI09821.1 hypothetical protein [Colidextribacter sp. OB.20]
MAKFQLLPGETLIGGGHMTYWHERYNYSGKSDSLSPRVHQVSESTKVYVTDQRVFCAHFPTGMENFNWPLEELRGYQRGTRLKFPSVTILTRDGGQFEFCCVQAKQLAQWLRQAGLPEVDIDSIVPPMTREEKVCRLPGRIAFYLLAILSLLVVFALPTSWVYDLGLKAGTEQGQRPGASVQTVQTREDIHALILANAPATVSPEGLIPCPLARLRDGEQSNRRIHYSPGRRSSRTFQGFDDYRVLPRDPNVLDRLWQLLWGGTYNSGYYLKPLEDGTYLCVYLDDCAFLFGEPEELYTGKLRSVDAPEEARMLHAMEAAGYDLDTSFILDMYRHGKVNEFADIAMRGGLWLAGVFLVSFVSVSITDRKKQPVQ